MLTNQFCLSWRRHGLSWGLGITQFITPDTATAGGWNSHVLGPCFLRSNRRSCMCNRGCCSAWGDVRVDICTPEQKVGGAVISFPVMHFFGPEGQQWGQSDLALTPFWLSSTLYSLLCCYHLSPFAPPSYLQLSEDRVVIDAREEDSHCICPVVQIRDPSSVQVTGQLIDVSLQLSKSWKKKRTRRRKPWAMKQNKTYFDPQGRKTWNLLIFMVFTILPWWSRQ